MLVETPDNPRYQTQLHKGTAGQTITLNILVLLPKISETLLRECKIFEENVVELLRNLRKKIDLRINKEKNFFFLMV